MSCMIDKLQLRIARIPLADFNSPYLPPFGDMFDRDVNFVGEEP